MPVIVKDPTLPTGWEALYDDAQQVTYYWQRSTNITTYDKPAAAPLPVCLHIGLSSLIHEVTLDGAQPATTTTLSINRYIFLRPLLCVSQIFSQLDDSILA